MPTLEELQERLDTCEDEVIHKPGNIQSHGYLFVLGSEEGEIVQVSTNVDQILDTTPAALIGTSFYDLLGLDDFTELKETFAKAKMTISNPLRLPLRTSSGELVFDGIAHYAGENLIVELENSAPADLADGITSRSLDHLLGFTSRAVERVSKFVDLSDAAAIICREVKEFTHFDRVMLYQFAENGDGQVIGEAREEHLEPFLHLQYPASDIPRQAIELYKVNWLRLVGDVSAPVYSLYPEERELDMTHSALRAVSPFHVKYLENMGVRATMSISLMYGDQLWGLIACHHYSGPKVLSYVERTACTHFGLIASANLISRLEEQATDVENQKRAAVSEVTRSLSRKKEFILSITESLEDLLSLIEADGVSVVFESDIHTHGTTPEKEEINQLIDCLEQNSVGDLFSTNNVLSICPALAHSAQTCAGVLSIQLAKNWYILYFRQELKRTVKWGGNPQKAKDLAGRLTPRGSFAEWQEKIEHQSKPWADIDLVLAEEIRSSLAAFVIQHNLQLQRLNGELFDKNAEVEQFVYSVSHDLKSPLVTISGFVGALKDDLDEGDQEMARSSLRRIETAADRMSELIDDLLDFSRLGRTVGEPEMVNMSELLEELVDDFRVQNQRETCTIELGPVSVRLKGFEEGLRRVFQNLIGNALKYGHQTPDLKISIQEEQKLRATRYTVTDNGPGIDPRFHEMIFQLFNRADSSVPGTGVGLATVKKVANLHGGSCGVDSESGKGATFWIEIPVEFQRSLNE